jgi:hypothetical protein
LGHPSIDTLQSFPETAYEDLDLNRLAAFAVKQLQDRQVPATFENIVVAAFRMFPEKFSLVGFPEYPDAARTNRALLQLGPKYRGWARGSVQKGFVLTESGGRVAHAVEELLGGERAASKSSRIRQRALPRTRDLAEEIRRIEVSSLYRKWKEKGLASAGELEFVNFLGVFAYTPPHVMVKRLRELRNTAVQLERADIVEFVDELRARFGRLLKEED